MKKIFLLLVIASIFAVENIGTIKIVKKDGQTFFYKNNKEFQLTGSQLKIVQGNMRMLSEATVEYEEADLPVELFGMVAVTAVANDSALLVTAKNPANVKVAIIDTGADINNSYLKEYCLVNTNEIAGNGIDDDNNGYIDDYYGVNIIEDNGSVLDDQGHGTCMLSEVAMQSNGNAKIIPIKAFDSRGCSSQFIIAKAIGYAVERGADVINCSFGYPNQTETLRLAIQYALDNGVIVVAAAGNNGQEIVMYPAGYPGVMAVSSLDDNDRLSYFSNYGDHIKVSC
ncbi:MAG: S8 family serine peptidase, partial [Candidatus Riflemargulisbacteria bacterium]